MERINLDLQGRSYDILISEGALSSLKDEIVRLNLEKHLAVVVSNRNIYSLYKGYLEPYLEVFKESLFLEVADSEKSKSWQVLFDLLRSTVEFSKAESVLFIAFGGGVVGDLVGFLAAIYKRGVPFIQIPTTLLAQVDSSIGGKVAIDLKWGKNLLGAFYQPKLVVSDLNFLKSLPLKEFSNGLSEIIKYGILGDVELFELLESSNEDPSSFSLGLWGEIVLRCSRIKTSFVERDEYDSEDIRIALNLGHTIAHAIETVSEYKRVSHGEAVSFGLVVESLIANKLGVLKENDLKRIINLILKFKTLPKMNRKMEQEKILSSILYDKKAKFGTLRFVLPSSIGLVAVSSLVDKALITSALSEGLSYL
ncbi:MAG: 3-dehydroquinate synthase [Candidatus Kaelpia aquatica]|nr:3-dehydroquinate synthase [Candidatus Kaelpia aquatica]